MWFHHPTSMAVSGLSLLWPSGFVSYLISLSYLDHNCDRECLLVCGDNHLSLWGSNHWVKLKVSISIRKKQRKLWRPGGSIQGDHQRSSSFTKEHFYQDFFHDSWNFVDNAQYYLVSTTGNVSSAIALFQLSVLMCTGGVYSAVAQLRGAQRAQ